MQEKIHKFKYWFENVFWYHYRLHFLGGLFALFVVVSMVVMFANVPKRDYEMAIVAPFPITEEEMTPLLQLLAIEVGDTDGNGKLYYLINPILVRNEMEEAMGEADTMRLINLFATPENKLFFMDSETADFYLQQTDFIKGSDIGLPFDTAKIPLGNLAAKGFLPPYLKREFFALIQDMGDVPGRVEDYYEYEYKIISRLLEAEELAPDLSSTAQLPETAE